MVNFLQRPALRGFRIAERRTQASGNGHTVARPVRVSEAQVRWPLRFRIAALLFVPARLIVFAAPMMLTRDGLLAPQSSPLTAIGCEADVDGGDALGAEASGVPIVMPRCWELPSHVLKYLHRHPLGRLVGSSAVRLRKFTHVL